MFKKSIQLNPKASRVGESYFVKGSKELVCRGELSKLFTLPKDRSTPITLVFSGEESPNSYSVRFLKNYYNCEMFYEDGWSEICLTGDAESYVDKVGLRGKIVWVTVHWEE